jgi:hypothetical protein
MPSRTDSAWIEVVVTAAIDSNILTYFLQAASGLYNFSNDWQRDLRAERLAAMRLFLYGAQLVIVPKVMKEAEDIGHSPKRKHHLEWIWVHFAQVLPTAVDEQEVSAREAGYLALHAKEKDCRAVAEAESAELERFLTFDKKLLKHLAGNTERILVQTPSQCWADLAIPTGTPPKWEPAPTNPLAEVDWWRW